MSKLVLAGKPSVAQSIARVIGANRRGDRYLEGNGYGRHCRVYEGKVRYGTGGVPANGVPRRQQARHLDYLFCKIENGNEEYRKISFC